MLFPPREIWQSFAGYLICGSALAGKITRYQSCWPLFCTSFSKLYWISNLWAHWSSEFVAGSKGMQFVTRHTFWHIILLLISFLGVHKHMYRFTVSTCTLRQRLQLTWSEQIYIGKWRINFWPCGHLSSLKGRWVVGPETSSMVRYIIFYMYMYASMVIQFKEFEEVIFYLF